MASPPTGTVTFPFTDIEGSTRLWERDAPAMQVALARHDEILRSSIEGRGGYIRKKPESRVYLDSLDDEVQIREVVEKYEGAIRALCQWFGEQRAQVYRSEFAELTSLETRYEQVRQEWEEAGAP